MRSREIGQFKKKHLQLRQLSCKHAIGLFGTFQQIPKKVGHKVAREPISGLFCVQSTCSRFCVKFKALILFRMRNLVQTMWLVL